MYVIQGEFECAKVASKVVGQFTHSVTHPVQSYWHENPTLKLKKNGHEKTTQDAHTHTHIQHAHTQTLINTFSFYLFI